MPTTLNSAYLQQKFEKALSYTAYLETGTDEQRRRWQQVHDAAHLAAEQTKLVRGFGREIRLLTISGIWCGDCVQQVPLIERIAEANPQRVQHRILDRDQNRDLSESLKINGGDRVPVVLFLAEDYEPCAAYGDRTIHRYRAMAQQRLGAACPVAIAPPDKDEMASTLADWLSEIERIELMLRLSPRLRQKHGD